ncbi:hypothetical protein [Streptomyces sp. CB01881]|uniref:hypothetical protein n=1 Tax=Streptomyces sp. CB01881 TaxID=2078691 RepID=UPI000CDCAAE8|nr:hypothetical protein [Streptomyces sp. CB01881]AUY51625.1 hypothetical protein C2142_24830 [Streptomyces sp. CB01881]TYC71059.1 hypothetical protein EH183_24820 [Streptomyces sp. CB01881]
METSERPERAAADRGSCGRYLLAPALAAVGAVVGTRMTVRAWNDCPLGNNVSNTIGLQFGTVPTVWLTMTVALALLQALLGRHPLPGGRTVELLAPVVAAVVLTALYRAGMNWPHIQPDGGCFEGYPLFPFTGKVGPHTSP